MPINEILLNPNLNLILDIFILAFGLCFGSFLNVCIYRIPLKESIIITPSHCTSCGHKIRFYENIPVIAWLILRGKCSKCHSKISFIYPAVEILTAIIVFLFWLKAKNTEYPIQFFLMYLNLAFLLIPTFFIDLRHNIIPNKLTYTSSVIAVGLSILFPQLTGYNSLIYSFPNAVLGIIVPGFILILFAYIGKVISKKDVLGFGDIKFIAALGAIFGLKSLSCFAVLVIGSLLGAFFGIFLILLTNRKWMTAIPFGPFLVTGTLLWIFFGTEITTFYIELLQKFLL